MTQHPYVFTREWYDLTQTGDSIELQDGGIATGSAALDDWLKSIENCSN